MSGSESSASAASWGMFSAPLPDHSAARGGAVILTIDALMQDDMSDSRSQEDIRPGAPRSNDRPRPQLIRCDAPRDHAHADGSSLGGRRANDTIGRIGPRLDPDPPRGDPPAAA